MWDGKSSDLSAGSVNGENGAVAEREPEVVSTEQVTESSAAPEVRFYSPGEGATDVDGNYLVEPSDSEQAALTQIPVSIEGESNGSVDFNSSTNVQTVSEANEGKNVDDRGGIELNQIKLEESTTSTDQESANSEVDSANSEVDDVDHGNVVFLTREDTMEENQNNGNMSDSEDAGKEEMFVDAPDQLTVGRTPDLEESMIVIEAPETEDKEYDHIQSYPHSSTVMEDKLKVHQLIDELGLVRSELDRTLREKELMAKENKVHEEEREKFVKELSTLHSQLLALSSQQALLGENGDGFVNRLRHAEELEGSTGSEIPLHGMFSDCSMFVSHLKTTIDEQLQTESTTRELHGIVFVKEQEIEELHTKVTDLSVSQDVFSSYIASVQKEYASTQRELFQQKIKELDFVAKLNKLEERNQKLLEDLDKANEKANVATVEASKTKLELEQTESKLANSREKLTMAVTKGKALVQQRDSLRLSLNEKTSELEKCLLELQQQSEALESAEVRYEELLRTQDLVVSLQKSLSERDSILKEIEETISQVNTSEEIESLDVLGKIRWLVDQKSIGEGIVLENHKIRDALSAICLPEKVSSSDLESQIEWLGKSLVQAKDDLNRLLDKVVESQEAIASRESQLSKAHKDIDNLTATLLSEKEEKDLLQTRLEDLTRKYDVLTEQLSRVSSEKDVVGKKLLEVVGSHVNDVGTLDDSAADTDLIVDKCITMLEERSKNLEDLKEKYEVLAEKSTQISSENDRLMKMLLEVSGSTMADRGCDGPPTDTDMLIEACFGRITERNRMLEDVTRKYEELVDKSNQSSSVKDVLLQKLIDVSGFRSDDQCPDDYSAEVDVLIEKFIRKIKDRISASESSIVEKEQFQRLQCLLYLSMHDLKLFELIAEEDCFDRSEIERLSTELSRVSEEIVTLKIERDSLHKDLERADEKVSILREKLSLAVKKGKGLMQDRDGLKLSMDEKNKEIERLKEEIQQQESALNECKDQIKSLRSDLELIPKLESDIVNAERFLSERTNALQRLTESIEGLILPKKTSNDVVFEDPVEKVKWLQEFIQESQLGRAFVEQELQKAKEEAELLAVKLEESHVTIRSQQDALLQAERSILVFGDEMQDLEAVKISLEQELGKEKTDKELLDGRLMDANKSINTLQDTLALIENEVQNAKEEAYLLAEKLEESNVTIRSLEDALSQAQRTVSSLDEEKKKIEAARISAEEELERGKADSVLLAGKLTDAHETIKSLEDSLLQAENNVSLLKNVKNEAELQSKQEIMSLKAKLAACMEELEGTHGRIENQSSELIDQLRHLHMLVTNNDLLSALDKEFQRKHEGLRNLSLLLQDIQEQFGERSQLQNLPDIESYLHTAKPEFGDNLNHSVENSDRSAGDISESISSYIPKVLEGFLVQNKLLTGKFECFSSYMDEHVGVLSQALQATRNEVVHLLGVMESLKLNMKNFEASNQGQENKITMLHNNVEVLYAACSNAIQELQTVCKVLDSNSSAGLDSLDLEIRGGDNAPEEQLECIKAAEKLSVVVKHMQAKTEEFMSAKTVWLTLSEELQDELRHTKLAAENARKEKELSYERVHNLEEDLDALQISCREMKLKLEDYQVKEDKLREKEQELPLQYQTSLATDQEVEEHLLSKSELEMLCSKVNKMEVQMGQSEVWSPEMRSPGVVDKIFYIINNFALLQNGVNSLASDKEKLQSSLAAQYVEIEHLKSEIESFTFIKQDVEMKNNELAELALGLERIIGTLGGSDNFEDKKISGVKGQIPVLEELAMGLILEAESSKAKTQEMGTKLQGSQNLVDELSAKVKLLEEAVRERQVASDTIQERSIYETPSILGSEISEVEDEAQVGIANKIPPVLPSAHVRTMRKASSDHLAIDINSESDRLLNHHEVDEDKGHVFKSLNSSGFIPKQGKSIADRVDGIWVAGGRLLVSRPGARMGLIAYWLLLHIWVLGSIL
ncbi:trans-Golgi network-localized SYP41-interacting protein 1-like isoform X2 [Aristolochia californica]|uniref:trans-Golgi network-localized SYP41-interacting protein 1-like isoform X2 n=1 Tax=Aristolochia californica TaxID=171875 RepID=UPI0035D76234